MEVEEKLQDMNVLLSKYLVQDRLIEYEGIAITSYLFRYKTGWKEKLWCDDEWVTLAGAAKHYAYLNYAHLSLQTSLGGIRIRPI